MSAAADDAIRSPGNAAGRATSEGAATSGAGAGTAPNARLMLFVLFAINLLNFYDRQIIGILSEPIRKEFALGDQALGWLNTAFVLFYAAVGLPLGRWSDLRSRVKILAAGVAVWSLFTGFSGLARGYWTMFVARMGVGFGEASCSPASNSLLGDLFPPARRARAISIFMLGLPIGIFLSNLISGLVAKAYGWRMSFFVATIPGLLLAWWVSRMREPRRGAADAALAARTAAARAHDDAAHADHHGFWKPYLQLMKIPTLRWIVLSGALHNFNAYAVNGFLASYLARWHKLPIEQVSVVSAVAIGLSGLIGLVIAGIVADKLHAWRQGARLTFGAIAVAAVAPLLWFAIAQPPGQWLPFAVLLGLGWTCFYAYYATVYASVHDVVRPELRARAMSLYFFWMYVLGGAFGTAILGFLSDRAARTAMTAAGATEMTEAFRATGLHDAFLVVPVVAVALSLVLFAASATIKKDIAAVSARA
ncbi:MAG: MFS transporter [Gemmatimonadetes bacterium]|nr:MFS transporter [Gemmatimonadota bacterium]